MKKPFKYTKLGKLLTSPLAKGIISKVPIVGGMAGELLNDTSRSQGGTEPGTLSREKLVHYAIKMAIAGILVYLVFSGKISWDDADTAKTFITQ